MSLCGVVNRVVDAWADKQPSEQVFDGLSPEETELARAIAKTQMLNVQFHGRRVLARCSRLFGAPPWRRVLFDVPKGWQETVKKFVTARHVIVASEDDQQHDMFST